MDAIRIIRAQPNEIADQPAFTKAMPQQPEGSNRPFADWELLLAGGGEVDPAWP